MARIMIPFKSSANVFSSYIVNIVVEPPNGKKTNKLDHFPQTLGVSISENVETTTGLDGQPGNLTHGALTMCRSCLNQNPLCR